MAVARSAPTRVLGYYSIAPASIDFDRIPTGFAPRLGRYPVPVSLLARLAVDRDVQGQGLGFELLLEAGRRAMAAAEQVGGVALLIDALHERAAAWYAARGAQSLPDEPLALLLPLSVVAAAIEAVIPPLRL